jgi:hypothetical protein
MINQQFSLLLHTCSLNFLNNSVDLADMIESQSAPLPRSEFTAMEEEIFSDLSGDKTLKMIGQIRARAASWQSKKTDANKDLVERGTLALGDCASILEDVWQSVHHRTLDA